MKNKPVNVNKKLEEICKNYLFEYEMYVEKIKVNNENPNMMDNESIMTSTKRIREIKNEILNLLLTEINIDSQGNVNFSQENEKISKDSKPHFKMMF